MATCGSCQREIEWAISTKSGKRIPLDVDEVDGGNILIVGHQQDGTPLATFSKPGDRVSHFATCPHAAKHRKK